MTGQERYLAACAARTTPASDAGGDPTTYSKTI